MVEYYLVERGSVGNQNSIIAEEKKNYWAFSLLLRTFFFVCLTIDAVQDLEFIVEDYKK